MLVYFAPFAGVFILWFFVKNTPNKDKVLGVVFCFIFAILLSLRSKTMGVDLEAYYNSYTSIKSLTFKEVLLSLRYFSRFAESSMESGYILLTWVFSKIGLDFQFFLVFQSLFCMGTVYYFCNKNSVNSLLSILLVAGFGTFSYFFCILRQSIAFCILLFAVTSLKNKENVLSLFLIALAGWFHLTSLSFLLVFLLSFIRPTKKSILIYLFCSIMLLPLVPILYKTVFGFLLGVLNRTGYKIQEFEFVEMFIVMVCMALYVMLFADLDKLFEKRENIVIFWGFAVSIPCTALGCYAPVFTRVSMAMYLPFASVILVNATAFGKKEGFVKYCNIGLFALAFAYYIYLIVTEAQGLHLRPYIPFFSAF